MKLLFDQNLSPKLVGRLTITVFFLLFIIFFGCLAQTPPSDRQQFIRVEAPVIALIRARVIDGTGAAPRQDQTIIIADSKIQSIGPDASTEIPANAR